MSLEETRRAIEAAKSRPRADFPARLKSGGRVLCGAPGGCLGEGPMQHPQHPDVFELDGWRQTAGVWQTPSGQGRRRRDRFNRAWTRWVADSLAEAEAAGPITQASLADAFWTRPGAKTPDPANVGRGADFAGIRRLPLPAYFRCPKCGKVNQIGAS